MDANDPRLAKSRTIQRLYPTADQAPLTFESLVSGKGGSGEITPPGPRPVRYQSALNFQILVQANRPVSLTSGQFAAETIVVDVISTAANSVFFGYGSQISPSSGIEVRPGLPLSITADDYREQWELQRPLEMLAASAGWQILPFRASRNVFDASQFFLVAAADTTVAVMLFPPSDN